MFESQLREFLIKLSIARYMFDISICQENKNWIPSSGSLKLSQ